MSKLQTIKYYFWQVAAQSGAQFVTQAGEPAEQHVPKVVPVFESVRPTSLFKAPAVEAFVLQQSAQLSWQQATQSSWHFTQSTQQSGPQSAQPLQQAALANFAESLAWTELPETSQAKTNVARDKVVITRRPFVS